jgi:hypothetical protein
LEDVFGQWTVEVLGHGKRPSSQPERPGCLTERGDGPQFSDRAAAAGHEETLPGLDAIERGREVVSQLLKGDRAHASIVAEHVSEPKDHPSAERLEPEVLRDLGRPVDGRDDDGVFDYYIEDEEAGGEADN